jgi:hypothetical protein
LGQQPSADVIIHGLSRKAKGKTSEKRGGDSSSHQRGPVSGTEIRRYDQRERQQGAQIKRRKRIGKRCYQMKDRRRCMGMTDSPLK